MRDNLFQLLSKNFSDFFAKSIPNKVKACERSLITENKRIEEKIHLLFFIKAFQVSDPTSQSEPARDFRQVIQPARFDSSPMITSNEKYKFLSKKQIE